MAGSRYGTPEARNGHIQTGLDGLESLAGLIQNLSITAAVRRELARLKPMIKRDLVQARGTLLVLRMEKSGIGEHIVRVLGVCHGGPGDWPEPAVQKWASSAHIFPAASGTVEETYLWVVMKKSLVLLGHRPPGWYAKSREGYKVLVFEEDIAPL
ncbi:MAG: hypothetical protein L6R30_18205 [Thermoanaerobaculia bacterium]|nr:hypothetical protein [Thermoanaerobaculia bacterium]MCK6684339.1 hypothetical protein [Thermoanaerobaculia bacterium]